MNRRFMVVLVLALLITISIGSPRSSQYAPLASTGAELSVNSDIESHPVFYASFEDPVEFQPKSAYSNQTRIGNLVISAYLENTTFLPAIARNLTITIFNNGTSSAGVFGISLNLPYFLVAYEYMILENASGVFKLPFEYITVNPVGNVLPGDTLRIRIPIEGAHGKKELGTSIVVVYMGATKLVSWRIEVAMFPMFIIEASLRDSVLNITAKNFTIIDVYIRNIFPVSEDICNIKNINITVFTTPESKIEPAYVIVDELNNTVPLVNKSLKIRISKVGAYEITVYAIAESALLVNANKTVQFPGEVYTKTILIATTQKLIIFDEGHYQYYRFASRYMQGVIRIASKFGPVLINRGKFTSEMVDPSVTSLIIIPNPQPSTGNPADETTKIFSDDEVVLLRSFLENGGSLLLMGNYYRYFWPKAKQNGFDAITGKYGIYWIDGDVYDNTSNYGRLYDVRVTNYGNNSVARLMTMNMEAIRFSGTALNITSPQMGVSVDIYPVLLGDNDTFVTLGEATDPPVVIGTDVIMAAAAVVNGIGKIFASGSSYMFSDYYYFGENSGFIENIFSWLFAAQRLDLIVKSKPSVRAGEIHYVILEIINRGVFEILNISLKIVAQAELKYMNQTQVFSKERLEPGELWTLCLAFKASTAGDFFVRFILSASNYPEISKTVFLKFEAVESPVPYVIAGVLIAVVITGVIVARKRMAKGL